MPARRGPRSYSPGPRPRRQTAIIYDSPVTGTKRHIAYGTLLERTARAAGALRSLGVKAGDRVLIYMPMVTGPRFPPNAPLIRAHWAGAAAIDPGGYGGHACVRPFRYIPSRRI